MTEKELKKLNRYQLLELLIMQTERADKLQKRLDETEDRMRNMEIQISSMGSIAEASLQLSGIFKAAQDAADMYVNAAKRRAEEVGGDVRIKDTCSKDAEAIVREIEEACRTKGE